MTPEERAAEITQGWGLIRVEISTRTASESPYVVVENGGQWARSLIAAAIGAAVDAERERCANLVENLPIKVWEVDLEGFGLIADAIRKSGSAAGGER